jgi:hypothetical protein
VAHAAGDVAEIGRLEAWMWPRLGEITVPTLVMIGRLNAEGARLRWLDSVAHVPHLEGDPATLDGIAAFVNTLT